MYQLYSANLFQKANHHVVLNVAKCKKKYFTPKDDDAVQNDARMSSV